MKRTPVYWEDIKTWCKYAFSMTIVIAIIIGCGLRAIYLSFYQAESPLVIEAILFHLTYVILAGILAHFIGFIEGGRK